MDRAEAIKAAFAWLEIREEVRKELIEAAREAHPHSEYSFGWENSTVRKLYQFPSDLSEQRLLGLIGDKDG